MFAGIFSDLRFGLRQFRKSPRFFALLFSLVVLGVGATTAMFSITRALMKRSLPFPEPEQLLMLWGQRTAHPPGGDLSFADRSRVSLLDFQSWSRSGTLEQACIVHPWLYSLTAEGQPPQGLVGAVVSGGFFPMLGVAPLLGRFFGPEDDRPGAAPVVVIGASVWHEHFASDPNAIGKTVLLEARPYTLVGVAPPSFDFSFPGNERAHVWTPLRALPEEMYAWYSSRQDIREWYAMARRKADASLEDVRVDLSRVAATAQPRDGEGERIDVGVEFMRREVVHDVVSPLLLRFIGVALVFFAICSNVSSLLLVRAEARRGELAVRAAFGATRARLMRQVLTETLLLFLFALPFSVLAASLMVDAFRDYTVEPRTTLAQLDVSVDPQALFFCLGLCLSAGLLSGWLPALAASRVDLFSVLKQAGSGASIAGSRTGLRAALVVIQVALAFALLTSSGLALTALAEMLQRPAGFEPEGLVTARLMGVRPEDDQPVRRNQLLERVMERLRSAPGVQSVAANVALPLSGYDAEFELEISGREPQAAAVRSLANRNVVSPDYFETMRIPLLRGRTLLASDEATGAPVVVISQRLAQKYFRGEDPIGRRLRYPGAEHGCHEIVGVVGDVRRYGLADPVALETYYPMYPEVGGMVIVARAERPERLMAELPQLVASVDPLLGVWTRRMDERMAGTLTQSVRISIVLGVFAALALLLASLGLYGLVSYSTTLKTREFGIRIALGSPLGALTWRVMRSGLIWLGLGSAVGLLAALGLGSALALALPGVRSFDPGVYALVALALGLSGALASFVPAWRTVRVSPASALRYE